MRPVFRSPTNAAPEARKTMPQGTSRSSAIVSATRGRGAAVLVGVGVGLGVAVLVPGVGESGLGVGGAAARFLER